MIVEFIGPSGAGKSSLASALALRSDAEMAWNVVLDRPSLRSVSHPTVRNLLAELVVVPSLIRSWNPNQEFMAFVREHLAAHSRSRFERLNYQRSVLRKVGMHELARRRAAPKVVLSDEGTLLIAYYLFVYSRSPIRTDDLDRFVSLVPLPDRVVYVRAPLPSLVERAIRRPDMRRELTLASPTEVAHWIGRAMEVFEYLAGSSPIRDRVLVVDNADGPEIDRSQLVDRLSLFIADTEPAPSGSENARNDS